MYSKIYASGLLAIALLTIDVSAQPTDPSTVTAQTRFPTIETSPSMINKRIVLHRLKSPSWPSLHNEMVKVTQLLGMVHAVKDQINTKADAYLTLYPAFSNSSRFTRTAAPAEIPADIHAKILETEGIDINTLAPQVPTRTVDPSAAASATLLRIAENEALMDQESSRTRDYMKKIQDIEDRQHNIVDELPVN